MEFNLISMYFNIQTSKNAKINLRLLMIGISKEHEAITSEKKISKISFDSIFQGDLK